MFWSGLALGLRPGIGTDRARAARPGPSSGTPPSAGGIVRSPRSPPGYGPATDHQTPARTQLLTLTRNGVSQTFLLSVPVNS